MSIDPFLLVLLASLSAGLVTTIGIYMIRWHEAWGRANVIYFMSFAAGVLIAVSFLHIVPNAVQLNERAPAFLLVGFLGLYLFNRLLKLYVCQEHTGASRITGLAPWSGSVFIPSWMASSIPLPSISVSLPVFWRQSGWCCMNSRKG